MVFYIAVLLACLNTECAFITDPVSHATEEACRKAVVQKLVPQLKDDKNLQVMALCVPYPVTKI